MFLFGIMKRVFIVHKWGGTPSSDWYPWLKKELEAKGYSVEVPSMPDTDNPKIDAWVGFLKEKVGNPDKDTYLVGHSIGCQTILRYLEKIDTKVSSVVLVAGWVNLTPETFKEEGAEDIAKPWLETPLDWDKIKANCGKFLSLFSDDDKCVPVSDAEIFKEKLGGEIIIQKGKGHYTEEDDITEIPVVLEFFEKL